MEEDIHRVNPDNGGGVFHGMGQSMQGNSAEGIPARADSPSALFKGPGLMERVQARVRPDEQYREEIVKSIFGEVGTPVEDFSCAVVSRILLHGRMYVTSTFVCFYSNLFGFEKIVKIPFCHMRCITKEKTALFIPNAIAIITSRKEYIFRSFWDREDAFRTLKACHQASLQQGSSGHSLQSAVATSTTLRERGPEEARRSGRRIGGRSNSDPLAEEKGAVKSGQSKRRLPWSGRGERNRTFSSIVLGGGDEDRRRQSSSGSSVASSGASSVSFHGAEDAELQDVQDPQDIPSVVGNTEGTDSRLQQDVNSVVDSTDQGNAQQQQGVLSVVGNTEQGDAQRQQDVLSVVGITAECVGEEAREGQGLAGGDRHKILVETGGSVGSVRVEAEEQGESQSRDGSDGGGDSEVDVLGVEGTPVDAVNLGATTGGGQKHTKAEDFKLALQALGDGWLAEPTEGAKTMGSRGAATVRLKAELQCHLKGFFETFIANDAEKGLPGFHESIGDSDVRSTPWKVSGGALGMTREIRFVHPVSAPIGPSETRAVKLQRCRDYGEHGLILETSTHLEDIMMSDYFQIEDRCVVQPGREGCVRVDVEVEIKFVKSTMLRKTIETKSLNETKEVWESFVAMAKEALKTQLANQQLQDSDQDSDDEDLMRRTRERLRERRKHRHRHRHNGPPPPPSHGHHPHPNRHPHPNGTKVTGPAALETIVTSAKSGPPRPRARSAAPSLPSRSLAEAGARGRGRTAAVDKPSKGAARVGVSVRATPIPSLRRCLTSFATVPWIILAVLLVWEMLQYLRFASETAGFLEASEAALIALEGATWEHEGGEEAVKLLSGAALKQDLARRLVVIYARNRFIWPFSMLFV